MTAPDDRYSQLCEELNALANQLPIYGGRFPEQFANNWNTALAMIKRHNRPMPWLWMLILALGAGIGRVGMDWLLGQPIDLEKAWTTFTMLFCGLFVGWRMRE